MTQIVTTTTTATMITVLSLEPTRRGTSSGQGGKLEVEGCIVRFGPPVGVVGPYEI